jgi:hypothetical protein
MSNGGKMTIETANAHLDEAYVSQLVEPVKVGQYVMIAVSDTGVGMDSATAARVSCFPDVWTRLARNWNTIHESAGRIDARWRALETGPGRGAAAAQ